MRILGLETSCDETAAAVVESGFRVLSSVVDSQIARHAPHGGVVPEIASRAHLENLRPVVQAALDQAGCGWSDLDAIAVTRGPGLAPALMIGVAAAKSLALALDRPLRPVHHLAGHAASVFLGPEAPAPDTCLPLLLLMVSGGHTQLLWQDASGALSVAGRSVDDAAGEALDKGAKLLGLGYPGGPEIERAAAGGDPAAIAFPRGYGHHAHAERESFPLRFSFSGLKTALLYHLRRHPGDAQPPRLADVCASYQEAVFDALLTRLEHALRVLRPRAFALVGGVARNVRLRGRITELSRRVGLPLLLAPPEYCTDNAAMIAAAGFAAAPDLDFDVAPTWPLPDLPAPRDGFSPPANPGFPPCLSTPFPP
jgi:N6-L-threonylcarbamoyladenine synthase